MWSHCNLHNLPELYLASQSHLSLLCLFLDYLSIIFLLFCSIVVLALFIGSFHRAILWNNILSCGHPRNTNFKSLAPGSDWLHFPLLQTHRTSSSWLNQYFSGSRTLLCFFSFHLSFKHFQVKKDFFKPWSIN